MFINIITGDIDRGIIKRKKIYLLFIAAVILLCIVTTMKLESMMALGKVHGECSVADLYMIFYKGSNIMNPGDGKLIYLTEQYLFLSLGMAYIIGNYAAKDLKGFGLQVIIRSRSAGLWWFGKLVWCVISGIIAHITIYITMIFICIIKGWSLGFSVNAEVLKALGYKNSDIMVSAGNLLVICILIPFLSVLALSVLQMFVSLLISPVVSLLLVTVEMLAAIYSNSAVFLSNGIMFVRNSMFYAGGTNSFYMILSSLIFIFLITFVGIFYFSKIDFL